MSLQTAHNILPVVSHVYVTYAVMKVSVFAEQRFRVLTDQCQSGITNQAGET